MGLLKIGQWGDNIESESERAGYYPIFLRRSAPERASDLFGGSYCLYNGVKTLAFQAKPLGQPHTSKFRKKKYRDTKLEVKKWKTIESQHIVRMISNIT